MPCIDNSYYDEIHDIIVVRFLEKRLSDPLMLDQQRTEMKQLLAREGAGKKFVLDFTGVAFVITNALNNLLVFNAQIARGRGRLALCGMTPRLRDIFQRTCLEDTVFHICDTLSDAVATLRCEDSREQAERS